MENIILFIIIPSALVITVCIYIVMLLRKEAKEIEERKKMKKEFEEWHRRRNF